MKSILCQIYLNILNFFNSLVGISFFIFLKVISKSDYFKPHLSFQFPIFSVKPQQNPIFIVNTPTSHWYFLGYYPKYLLNHIRYCFYHQNFCFAGTLDEGRPTLFATFMQDDKNCCKTSII